MGQILDRFGFVRQSCFFWIIENMGGHLVSRFALDPNLVTVYTAAILVRSFSIQFTAWHCRGPTADRPTEKTLIDLFTVDCIRKRAHCVQYLCYALYARTNCQQCENTFKVTPIIQRMSRISFKVSF